MLANIRYLWYNYLSWIILLMLLFCIFSSASIFFCKKKNENIHKYIWGAITLLGVIMGLIGLYAFFAQWEIWISSISPYIASNGGYIVYNPPCMYLMYYSNFSLKLLLSALPYDFFWVRHNTLLKYVYIKYCIVLTLTTCIFLCMYIDYSTARIYYNTKALDLFPVIHTLLSIFPHT